MSTVRSDFYLFPPYQILTIRFSTGVDPTGTYHGDSDLQLERINVYYNEVKYFHLSLP
jgi:hypothetical protein